ncbi:ankyrin repeat-containing domain protein, partial [Phyllosticta capitalensis]
EELEENPSWVRYRDDDGQTPLHIAAGKGDLKLSNFLIRKGATVNAEDNYMRTPLHYATMTNSTALVRAMLTNGASTSIEDEDGQPPLFYAQPNTEIHWLLLHGTATEARDTKGRTALCEFARLGATSVVRGLLSRGANVEAMGPNNWTALHEAADAGHAEICAALVEAGAPTGALSTHQDTPLFFAARGGSVACVELLVSRGVDINRAQLNDITPIGEAVSRQHADVVEYLIERGADAQRGSAFHPLLFAAGNGNKRILLLLLDKARVNINQRSWQSKTALIEAVQFQKFEMVKILLDHGADPRMREDFSRTAFFWAVMKNDRPIAELLLARDGGVLNMRDKEGVSPRGYAMNNGLKEMATWLEEMDAAV